MEALYEKDYENVGSIPFFNSDDLFIELHYVCNKYRIE
jgi:hypothetical protein